MLADCLDVKTGDEEAKRAPGARVEREDEDGMRWRCWREKKRREEEKEEKRKRKKKKNRQLWRRSSSPQKEKKDAPPFSVFSSRSIFFSPAACGGVNIP